MSDHNTLPYQPLFPFTTKMDILGITAVWKVLGMIAKC